MQEIKLTWGAWYGDNPLTIYFPSQWEIKVIGNNNLPMLENKAIKEKLSHPLGSPALSRLAKGKKEAVILIDDTTRPTPTDSILPFIIEELELSGMSCSDITVIIAGGVHRQASEEEIIKKVGWELVKKINIIVHNCEDDLKYMGVTKKGTPVYVNRTFAESDLKIGIGTVLPHPIAGFSGGSKILAPGICGKETTHYLHDYADDFQHDYNRCASKRVGCIDNDFRKEIDAIADIVGLDFIVNVVLNHKRKILDLFAGNRKSVYKHGASIVNKLFSTELVQADIIVANTYPFDTNLRYMPRGFWPFFNGMQQATKVVIGFGGDKTKRNYSKIKLGSLGVRFLKRFKRLPLRKLPNEIKIGINIIRKAISRKKLEYLFLCPEITEHELKSVFSKSLYFNKWDKLLVELEHRMGKQEVKVVVYPYAPLQFLKRNH